MNIKELFKRNKDKIAYIFFGICTTLVNVIIYGILAHSLKFSVILSTILAWAFAILFAYFTNRKWVFNSEAKRSIEIAKELFCFFACRIVTGVVDWIGMYVFVEQFKFHDIIIKILTNILVIILNYIASKLLVFKKRGKYVSEC